MISIEKAQGSKCPRCWRITAAGRYLYDGLCIRCVEVLLKYFPDLPEIPAIRKSLREFLTNNQK